MIEGFGNKYNFKGSLVHIHVHILLMAIVIIGAINWGTSAFGYNLVKMLSDALNNALKTNLEIDKTIYIIVAISGLLLLSKRETWLPFLGESVLPGSLIPLVTPKNTTKSIQINTIPNTKIAYWAALPKGEDADVQTAYGDYSNSGVVMSDANGVAELPIVEGSGYVVPSGRHISRHIHYRVIDLPLGMISKIYTVKY